MPRPCGTIPVRTRLAKGSFDWQPAIVWQKPAAFAIPISAYNENNENKSYVQ
jgi:hypothetical protein